MKKPNASIRDSNAALEVVFVHLAAYEKVKKQEQSSSRSGFMSKSQTSCLVSDWGNLPRDLLDRVFIRLDSESEYLRFSCVCKQWRIVAKNKLWMGSHFFARVSLVFLAVLN
ncbi:unnamed protein product [Prunus armeniaca]|uniref:F-box domain-containing protein n=1 Tax=Prunus armeniaca TaxID=36596 RepID=A0A6J5TII7_PRUAR|nr:unnamed protein product [Prunus armeniaca]